MSSEPCSVQRSDSELGSESGIWENWTKCNYEPFLRRSGFSDEGSKNRDRCSYYAHGGLSDTKDLDVHSCSFLPCQPERNRYKEREIIAMADLLLLSEISLRGMIRRNAMIPEHFQTACQKKMMKGRGFNWRAYNTPMLMATIAPSFPFLFIVTQQIIFQGRTASTMSSTPEYTLPSLADSARTYA
jgi:hypothetical protein